MTDEQKTSAAERHRQIQMAIERGTRHLGCQEASTEEKKRKREMKRDRGRRKEDRKVLADESGD